MTEIVKPTRAKAGWIETTRVDKYGQRSPSKVKQHITIGGGTTSTKEMEHRMIETAKEVGASEDQIHIESYSHDKAPLEVNPYHRGMAQRWEKSKQQREVTQKPFIRQRRVFGGVDLPRTPEEVAAAVADFEARKLQPP